ncbi:ABC transporter ATP-binding protein [Pseudoruegeria sp. SK021]|uniref:ABC transporter ATP-binding protein n=1 Tax=Pseudoruegeria sp. SK021 TaxID=1933035 RepID=UPI000A238E59|nr:ABC transporter ATP-binding protein [Pseudoruegeria sp. SK021]OSP56427.1 ABC transporter [Pseudoruegeria sp. SK021]
MGDPVLALSGIGRVYNPGQPGEVQVLRDLDLILEPGELVALVAPSGSGKSTLLHLAGLLDRPDTGSLRILGQDAGALKDGTRTRLRRSSIGFVYQFHHLLPEFTALENVVLPQLAEGVSTVDAATRAQDLLTQVGLSARMEHRPATLSGGEQQRVAFCRALANRPRLLLADEPTGNLDPDTAEQVFDSMLGLTRDTGLAALVATHNPALAARMDRQLRLEHGRLVPA